MYTRHFFLLLLLLCSTSFAKDEVSPFPVDTQIDGPPVDFNETDQFVDIPEAVASRSFVRRTVLSNAVKHSSRFQFERPYIQHMMGFNAVYQRVSFAKYTTGIQGVSGGYVFSSGDAFEGGIEFSAVSTAFVGYKHIFTFEKVTVWPFVGLGGGREISSLALSDPPTEAVDYPGRKEMGFVNVGLMVPLVDVGLRAEVRANFYGLDRLILTSGIGAVVFL